MKRILAAALFCVLPALLLDANPLEDIINTQKINAVVVSGKLIPKSQLKRMLDTIETASNRK